MIKNYMEDYVAETLEYIFKYNRDCDEICKCEICRDDIMAMALNKLPAAYATTMRGKVYAEYHSKDFQYRSDIVTELLKAIDCVSKNAHKKL